MPVFISHSHQDKEFVDRLAVQLVQHKAHIWLDRWELKVGDSIIEKVQSAIKNASALIIVLSKASVSSEWCRKELSAGLIRELEERRVVVLPLLLEDCDIPIFLRDKKYADFRSNFDDGLGETLKAIAGVTSDTQGRVERPEFHTDWGISWGDSGGLYALHVRFVDHSEKLPFIVLTEVKIICNEALTQKFRMYEKQDIAWLGRLVIVTSLNAAVAARGIPKFLLKDSLPIEKEFHFKDPKTGFDMDVIISSVRLGTDTGMNILMDWGEHIQHLLENLSKNVSEVDREKLRKVKKEG